MEFHKYTLNFNILTTIFTYEIAIKAEAYTTENVQMAIRFADFASSIPYRCEFY
jgi:hypothetical protein